MDHKTKRASFGASPLCLSTPDLQLIKHLAEGTLLMREAGQSLTRAFSTVSVANGTGLAIFKIKLRGP